MRKMFECVSGKVDDILCNGDFIYCVEVFSALAPFFAFIGFLVYIVICILF